MEGKVLKQKLIKKSLLSSTFLLTFSLVMIMTLSACEKSSSDDEGMDWKGVFSDTEPGYGWSSDYFDCDLPSEILEMLQYSTLEKDSAVSVGVSACEIRAEYHIRINENNAIITFNESSKADSLMEVRHYKIYKFKEGKYGRAEVTENAIIVDGGAWEQKLQAPYQYSFSKRTGKSESKPYRKNIQYSGEFNCNSSGSNTILVNKDYTFELSDKGSLIMTKPAYRKIGVLERE